MLTNQIERKLKKSFSYNLFSKDKAIKITQNIINAEQLNNYLSKMIDENILTSFEDVPNLYQFTKVNNDLGIPITIKATRDELVDYLYLENNSGYVYGNTVLERLGLSTQIAQEEYITTKNISANLTKNIENYTYHLKPAVTKINKNNKRLLQTIDTLLLPGILSDDEQSKESILEQLVTFALSTVNSIDEIQNVISKYSDSDKKVLEKIGFFNEIEKWL